MANNSVPKILPSEADAVTSADPWFRSSLSASSSQALLQFLPSIVGPRLTFSHPNLSERTWPTSANQRAQLVCLRLDPETCEVRNDPSAPYSQRKDQITVTQHCVFVRGL